MSSGNDKQWIVLDSITQIQSQPLSDQQLQMSILRMHEKDWDRFLIWKTDWEDWQPLRAFLKSDEKNFLNVLNINKDTSSKDETITKSVTRVRADEGSQPSFRLATEEHIDFDQVNVEIKPPGNVNFKKLNQRDLHKSRATRHDFKIEILLISKAGKTFRSYSKNISLSGTLLEDNIPFDYYGNTFDIVIVNRYAKTSASSRIQVKGCTVGDGVSRRLQYEDMNEQLKNRLVNLLNEYLEHQKSHSKKVS